MNKLICQYVVSKGGQYVVGMWLINEVGMWLVKVVGTGNVIWSVTGL